MIRYARYRAADPGLRVGWNRYPGQFIGAFVVIGSTCYSLHWRRPDRGPGGIQQ